MHEDDRISKFIPLMQSLYGAARETLGFEPHVKICIIKSRDNMQNPLGKTAYYSPSEHKIGLYTQGRHIKDILRSLAHELIHHNQNCRGDFDNGEETIQGYAQQDGHLREMEREAYEHGNMIFRDWEDTLKDKGGKPLFTSTSQYVPPPTSDVAGFPLLEKNKMNHRLNETEKDSSKTEPLPVKKDVAAAGAGVYVTNQKRYSEFYRNQNVGNNLPNPEKYGIEHPAGCDKYLKAVAKWVEKYDIRKEHYAEISRLCVGSSGDRGYRLGSHAWRGLQSLIPGNLNVGIARQYFNREGPWRETSAKPRYAESKINKTNNSLFEGDKMKNKLTKTKLQKAIQEELEEQMGGLNYCPKGGFEPGGKSAKENKAFLDCRDRKRKAEEKQKKAKEDREKNVSEEIKETFFPTKTSTRDKARNELNEGLMKRWGYTKEEK